MKKYKLGNILTISSTSITPQAGRTYHLYSLPSFDDGKVPEITKGENIQSNKYVVSNRCILFNKLNVRFKRIWRIENNAPNKLCSTEFLPLIIDESIIDYQYCYYLLASDDLTNYLCGINSNTSGSHKRINPDILLDLEVALPVLDEQKRIGSILANLDRKIALNRSINHNLEAMAKQLYDYWFVQFDFPDENGKPYKSSGGKMVWNEKLKREIPEGWEVKSIFEVISVQYGFPFSTEQFTEERTNVQVVRIRDILEGTTSAYSLEDTDEKYRLNEGDVLVGMDGNFHMNFWHNNEAYLNQRCVRLRPYSDSGISSIQILYSISPYIKAKEQSAKGSTVGHLSDKDLKGLYLVQSMNTMHFNSCKTLDGLLSLIIRNKKEVLSLTKLRDSLLPLLMNGQVSVNYDLSND